MRARRGQLLEVTVTDGRARLALTFFNRVQYWARQLTPGRHAMFAGRVSTFKGKRQLAHPEFKLLGADDAARAAEYAAELIPVYPATKDVSTWDIEKCMQIVLDTLGELDDPLPPPLREQYGLAGLADALRGIHRPADDATGAQRHAPAEVGRGARAPGRPGPAPPGRGRAARHGPPRERGRPGRRLRRQAPVLAHRGPARGWCRHLRRPGPRPPHAPAAARRGRLGQDRDRGAGHAPGHRRRRPGRTARPHRGARATALPVGVGPARPAGPGRQARRRGGGDQGGPAHRLPARRRAPGGAA